MLEDGCCCLPGSITPLDAAALALARNHVAAGATGTSAGARWAEAVYGHVVQHGTMDVPGLNRPMSHPGSEDDGLETDQGELLGLATAWAALTDRSPDADLLQRTRQCTNLPTILQVLAAAVSGNDGDWIRTVAPCATRNGASSRAERCRQAQPGRGGRRGE